MDINESLTPLIECLKLQSIQPLEIHSQRLGSPEGPNPEYQFTIHQASGTDDPLILEDLRSVFRVRYDFTCKSGVVDIYKHMGAFAVFFELVDKDKFTELWKDEALRKIFWERQIQKTLWPYLRQQVSDGMSRLGITPITLPWLM